MKKFGICADDVDGASGSPSRPVSPAGGWSPASALSPELAQALNQKLEAGAFRRAVDAQRWLREEGGLHAKLTTVYKYLKKAGARLKVPRPCHEKKDRWAAEAFRSGGGRAPRRA